MKFKFIAPSFRGKKNVWLIVSFLLPLSFLFVFFFYPLINIIRFAFFGSNGFSLKSFLAVLSDSYTLRVLAFTFKESFLSAAITLLIALPGAYIISHFRFKGRDALVSLATIPFILPSVLVALGFIILFGRSGMVNTFLIKILHFHHPVNLLYSFWGIILVHVFYNFPIPLRIIGASWDGLPKKYSFAAQSLGASNLEVFFKVTLPLLLPSVISSFTLVFMFCFLSFVIILVIGGAKFATLEVSIYTYYNMFFDFKTGSALALIQAAFTLLFVYVYMKTGSFAGKSEEKREIYEYKSLFENRKSFIFSTIYLIFVFPVIFLPLIVIFASSFTNPVTSEFTLNNFIDLFSGKFTYITSIGIYRVILNSIFFALFATALSTIFAVMISYSVKKLSKLKDFLVALLMLPIAISPVTIAFSYILTFRNTPVINSWLIIASAHTVIAFPFALKTLYPSVERMPRSLVYAAQSLGMNRLKTFFAVDLNLLRLPIIVSSIFVFAISLGEFGATFMLYKNKYITMPVALYRFISGRHFGIASAMGAVLSLMALLIFFLIDKFRKERRFR